MKTSIKLFALGMILMGFGVNANAQATASAPTSATIIAPITLTKDVDMNFGNVAVINAGTVILGTDGARSATGGVTVSAAIGGTITAAKFTVGGEGSNTYSITLPSSALTITRALGGTMTVDGFLSNPSGTGILTAGTQELLVGATLHVAAAQTPGLYTNATGFSVTVNYN